MNIDLTKLATNTIDKLTINESIDLSSNYYQNTEIRNLEEIKFTGEIKKISDSIYHISGKINGIMTLADDITLEDVKYPFESLVDENFGTNEKKENNLILTRNILDITDFLWQNILLEVPSKIKNKKTKNITLKGDGWQFITEEQLNQTKSSPFEDLKNKLNL